MTASRIRLLELRDLDVVLEVAEAGSFRGAAHALGIEPSAVSRRVRGLEERLGASLFERHRSGVRPTDAGLRFQQEVRLFIGRLDAAVRGVQEAGEAFNGKIDIGILSPPSPRLRGLFAEFRRMHSRVSINFVEGGYHDHAAALADGSLDLAVLIGTNRPEGCTAARLWIEPIRLALPFDDPRAESRTLPLAEVANDHFVVSADPVGLDVQDLLIRRLSDFGIHPSISRHRVGRETLMAMVGMRFGIGLVFGAETQCKYPDVAFVRLEGEELEQNAVWDPGNDNPALRRFLSLARRFPIAEGHVASASQTRDPSP